MVSENVATQLEACRIPIRAMKRSGAVAFGFSAQGIKIMVAGRLGGSGTDCHEVVFLSAYFRAEVDYGFAEVIRRWGQIRGEELGSIRVSCCQRWCKMILLSVDDLARTSIGKVGLCWHQKLSSERCRGPDAGKALSWRPPYPRREFKLKALEPGWITSRQSRQPVLLLPVLCSGGQVWTRIFPGQAHYTKKPAETRMGKGRQSSIGSRE